MWYWLGMGFSLEEWLGMGFSAEERVGIGYTIGVFKRLRDGV